VTMAVGARLLALKKAIVSRLAAIEDGLMPRPAERTVR
jgi:hypothetical protein